MTRYNKPLSALRVYLKKISSVFSVVIILVLFSSKGFAETTEGITNRMTQVKATLEQADLRLKEISDKRDATQKDIEAFRVKLKAFDAEMKKLNAELDALNKEKEKTANEVAQQSKRLEYLRQQSQGRLKVMYMFYGEDTDRGVLLRTSSGNLERHSVYLSKIRKFDSDVMTELKRVAEQLAIKQAELAKLSEEQKKLQAGLEVKRQETQKNLNTSAKLVKQLDLNTKATQQAKDKLNERLQELEMLLEEFMNVDSSGGVEPPAPAATPQPVEEVEEGDSEDEAKKEEIAPTPLPKKVENKGEVQLTGLFENGTKVIWPVKARVVSGFGKVKGAQDETGFLNKGLWFDTKSGEDVRAIAPGKVAYVGSMPRFGIVVIIDHGLRSYSLYGQLGASMVATGDMIKQSAAVGKTKIASESVKNDDLYFEIRRNGQPVNPDIVLKGR